MGIGNVVSIRFRSIDPRPGLEESEVYRPRLTTTLNPLSKRKILLQEDRAGPITLSDIPESDN